MHPIKIAALFFGMAALVLLVVASSFVQASAADRTPQVIREGEILRGRFVQDRRLTGFTKTLRTEGTFVLVPGKGLIWRAQTPFQNTVVISPGGLLVLTNGKEGMRLDAARMPGLGRIYEVLSGAVSGDLEALEKAFAVSRSDYADGWRLVLTPLKSDSMAASQIKSLTVTGHRFVDTIEIAKAGGDADFMTFLDQAVTTASPSAEELSQLQALNK